MQKPIKEGYRAEPGSSKITLVARGSSQDTPLACSVDIGRAIHEAQAHKGVGGAGTGACSGDLLLGALAACAQITCQMVSTALGVEWELIEATAEGDLDLQGTLGMSKDVPVGFEEIRLRLDIEAPGASEELLEKARAKTEELCVVFQTLNVPPRLVLEPARS